VAFVKSGFWSPLSKAIVGLRPVFFGPWSGISCTGRHQRMRVRLSLRKAA
jgi:hypothetical protein